MKKSRDEIALILALATGSSVREAAALSGFSERTAHRRIGEPGFQQRVSSTRDELWGKAVGKLASVAATAVTTLEELLGCDDAKVRLGAARAILAVSPQLRECIEHERRLTELEAQHAGEK
ncbi:hypothetical protein [Lacipirellula parvula]|uniref:Uncharacterized protein n=1 Tax=Lacipirellula parvula TaxID=2650471 RepID=A0A5K7XC84_9BACT|nr:hypothetical protein [Lacipirellula parvula]BBO31956.1 hypothetical protein PLANPX_1568 [Lacipirellula parvula]